MQNDERYTVLESAVQQVMLRAAEMDELFIDFHLKFTQKTAELRQEQKAIRTQMDGIGLALSRNGLAQEEPPRSQSPFLGVVPTGGSVDIAVSMTGGGGRYDMVLICINNASFGAIFPYKNSGNLKYFCNIFKFVIID